MAVIKSGNSTFQLEVDQYNSAHVVLMNADGTPVDASNPISFTSPQLNSLEVLGAGPAATAQRVQLSDESLAALENITVTIANIDVEVKNDIGNPLFITSTQLNSLEVVGVGAAATAQRVHLSNESLAALENITVTIDNVDVEVKNDVGNPLFVQRVWNLSFLNDSVDVSNSIINIRDTDGDPIVAQTTTVVGTESGLVVRPINSGALTVLGVGAAATAQRVHLSNESLTALENITIDSARITDSTGNAIVSQTTAVAGTEFGVVVRPINSGSLAVLGSGAAATAQRVHLSDESLAALETINSIQSGVWTNRIQDSAGNAIVSQTTAVAGTEFGVVVRPINSGALTVVGSGAGATAQRVQLSDESLAALETINAAQSGVWTNRIQDSVGNAIVSQTTTVAGTEPGLVVRPINSGVLTVVGSGVGATAQRVQLSDESLAALETINAAQSGVWTNRIQDSAGNAIVAQTTAVAGTESGVVVRPINSGSLTVVGPGAAATAQRVHLSDETLTALETVNVAQSGIWTNRIQDSTGNAIVAQTAAVAGTESGVVVRPINSGVLTVVGSGAAATAQRVHLSDESLAALEVIDTAFTTTNASTTAPTKIAVVGGITSDVTPQYRAIPLTNNGDAVHTVEKRAVTGTLSSVAGATATTTLLVANANRRGATIYNDSALNTMSLALGPGATATNFTVKVSSNGYFEVPYHYTGIITAVWQSATGNARITEFS